MRTNKKTCEVAITFNEKPHILSDFSYQCIDQVRTGTPQEVENILCDDNFPTMVFPFKINSDFLQICVVFNSA